MIYPLTIAIALGTAVAPASVVRGQCDAPPFHPFAIYGSTEVVPFDLDGTGNLELIHPDYGVFMTTFDEGLTPRWNQLIHSSSQTYAAAGDLDGDGDEDLVASVYPRASILRNESGELVEWQTLDEHARVYLADVESDGDLDLLQQWSSTVLIYVNDGDGQLSLRSTWSLPVNTTFIAPCSLNGDAFIDVLAHPCCADETYALLQRSDGGCDAVVSGLRGINPHGLADVNGDGLDDAAQDGGEVRLCGGDGTFETLLHAVPDGEIQALADVDADGDADVIAAYDAVQHVAIHINDGSGVFVEAQRFLPLKTVRGAIVVDMNRDGRSDLLVSSQHFLQLRLGAGGGRFEDFGREPTTPALGITPADLDADGDLDVLATTKDPSIGDYYLESFENDGIGGLTRVTQSELPQSVGVRPAAIDLDWDGDVDAVQPGWDKLLLHENTAGAFQLREQRIRQRASNPTDMAFVADFDGDGHDDLAFWDDGVKILLTRGDWSFEEIIPAFDAVYGFYGAQDVTGDGVADLLTSGRGDFGRITVFPGLGDAAFGAPIPVITSTLPDLVVAGDVDADGDCDLVYIEDEPYFVEQAAPGQFVERGVIGSGYHYKASALAIADVNRDGALDVVVGQAKSSASNAKVGVIFGDRSAPLSRELLVTPFARVLDVELSDMNGDGSADILLSDYMGYFDAWLYVVPNLCPAPCPGDFNDDGALDTRDVIAFLNVWVAGDSAADFDRNGEIDSRDVIAFLNAWTLGC